jgi:hypothetical protein|tara:strand:- start:677 stop:889 length:213 start_codon:yes stop_codon:yes gene_type:complete
MGIKKKIDRHEATIKQIIQELIHLKDLGVGTLETLKLMPGYKDAIEKLKNKIAENASADEKIKSSREISK